MAGVLGCCLMLILPWTSKAQSWKDIDPDEIFSLAKTEVFEGNRAEGQAKLKYILEKNPGYDDVKILLARSYSWDGLYDQARGALQDVLKKNADHRDALDALIDVELWSVHYHDALGLLERGLISYPNDEDFLYKQASALASLNRSEEAVAVLNTLLQINPAHEKGTALYDDIDLRGRKHTAAITYGTDFFNRIFDPAHYVSTQLSRTDKWGSSHVKFNYAQRFGISGSQFELDLYPKIVHGIYGWVNYGYSGSALFPESRLGAEMFFKLPKGLETSAGMRYMDFNAGTTALIYTGSIAWYVRNYWLSTRLYIMPNGEAGTSAAGTVSLRKYFSNAENYIGLNAGLGFSPDMARIQNSTGFTENEIHLLKSQRIGLVWQKAFWISWSINLSIEACRQELLFDQDEQVMITSSFVTVRKRF